MKFISVKIFYTHCAPSVAEAVEYSGSRFRIKKGRTAAAKIPYSASALYVFDKKTDWNVQNKHTIENTLCEFSIVINNEPETLAQVRRAQLEKPVVFLALRLSPHVSNNENGCW